MFGMLLPSSKPKNPLHTFHVLLTRNSCTLRTIKYFQYLISGLILCVILGSELGMRSSPTTEEEGSITKATSDGEGKQPSSRSPSPDYDPLNPASMDASRPTHNDVYPARPAGEHLIIFQKPQWSIKTYVVLKLSAKSAAYIKRKMGKD